MANPPPYNYHDIGVLGEDLVVQWLESTGWEILHRRWRCRWGEIDIIAQQDGEHICHLRTPKAQQSQPTLAFVEVKTRSQDNWDAGGRSAIALKKQTKLWRTAGIFLARYPQKADYTCQFDVAIVQCQRISQKLAALTVNQEALACASAAGYHFALEEYIPAAFDF
ncbi:MAG: YraN family protein [Stigonema ocellatum SAG 48.90 = DSM 106950]|nr:YraN family protein [Stigonema ocellatum SAG 48.90 = DSM 106950]